MGECGSGWALGVCEHHRAAHGHVGGRVGDGGSVWALGIVHARACLRAYGIGLHCARTRTFTPTHPHTHTHNTDHETIREHPWFADVDFEAVAERRVIPPHIPVFKKKSGKSDATDKYFEDYPEDDIDEDPRNDGPIDDSLFIGF